MNKTIKQVGRKSAHVHTYMNNTMVLFSYCTPIAAYIPDNGYHATVDKYSVTTTRHLSGWLRTHNNPNTIPTDERKLVQLLATMDRL